MIENRLSPTRERRVRDVARGVVGSAMRLMKHRILVGRPKRSTPLLWHFAVGAAFRKAPAEWLAVKGLSQVRPTHAPMAPAQLVLFAVGPNEPSRKGMPAEANPGWSQKRE